MSLETLNAFIAKVQSDSGLLEQVKAATDADGAVAIAKSIGFEITAGDLIRRQATVLVDLDDEQLELVSGGGIGVDMAILFFFVKVIPAIPVVAGVGAGVYAGIEISSIIKN